MLFFELKLVTDNLSIHITYCVFSTCVIFSLHSGFSSRDPDWNGTRTDPGYSCVTQPESEADPETQFIEVITLEMEVSREPSEVREEGVCVDSSAYLEPTPSGSCCCRFVRKQTRRSGDRLLLPSCLLSNLH